MTTRAEYDTSVKVCYASPRFKEAVAEFSLSNGFEIIVKPWPYGGLDPTEENRRYFQGLHKTKATKTKAPISMRIPYL